MLLFIVCFFVTCRLVKLYLGSTFLSLPVYLVMHQSFVTTATLPPPHTHLRGWAGESGANVRGSDLFSSPSVSGMCRASDLMQIYPMECTVTKSRAMTLSKSPQCRAFSWAVMDEKSLSPLFPVGRGRGRGAGGSAYK